ncbi:MAG: Rrf2 family transcriptional regulator [Candidatus Margulisiibacteriota bacterium]|nr:Rrf2 family transcriptional regulator [Candidatus Margulisiibacteriota bacterium]
MLLVVDKKGQLLYNPPIMKLSTRGRYAVSAMFDLASNCEDVPISAAMISKSQQIPLSYLEQILLKLKKGGLVKTTKGPAGGYKLAKLPNRISIGDIIKAADGPIILADCFPHGSRCPRSGSCSTKSLWASLSNKVAKVFDSTSLADLCKEKKR